MNPYEILGIPSNASDSEIRKRYRELSREMHPDRGGDVSLWEGLNKAYAIIGDPEVRKTYDLWGQDRNFPKAIEFLTGCIHVTIKACAQDGMDLQRIDLMQYVRTTIANSLEKTLETVSAIRKSIRDLGKVEDRFKPKQPVFENILDKIVGNHLKLAKAELADFEMQVEAFKLAAVIANEFEYKPIASRRTVVKMISA